MKKLVLLLPFLVAGLNAQSSLEQRVDLLEEGLCALVEKVNTMESSFVKALEAVEPKLENPLTQVAQVNRNSVVNSRKKRKRKTKKD